MQAFAGTSFDSLDSYALTELPTPEPGPGQVRLRVAATALGYVDGLMAQGRYQIKPPLPYVPGGEIAGVVEAVGAGVSTLAVGDRVVTWQLGGGMADCVVVDAADVDVVPGDLPLPVAAAMLVDYQTAHFALFERGRLSAARVRQPRRRGAVLAQRFTCRRRPARSRSRPAGWCCLPRSRAAPGCA